MPWHIRWHSPKIWKLDDKGCSWGIADCPSFSVGFQSSQRQKEINSLYWWGISYFMWYFFFFWHVNSQSFIFLFKPCVCAHTHFKGLLYKQVVHHLHPCHSSEIECIPFHVAFSITCLKSTGWSTGKGNIWSCSIVDKQEHETWIY